MNFKWQQESRLSGGGESETGSESDPFDHEQRIYKERLINTRSILALVVNPGTSPRKTVEWEDNPTGSTLQPSRVYRCPLRWPPCKYKLP